MRRVLRTALRLVLQLAVAGGLAFGAYEALAETRTQETCQPCTSQEQCRRCCIEELGASDGFCSAGGGCFCIP